MAVKVIKDTGMMQRTEFSYRSDDPADVNALMKAMKAMDAAMPVEQPGDLPGDAIRRHNAGQCQAILVEYGLGELMEGGKFVVDLGPLRAAGLQENSAAWIAAKWLGSYNRLMALRQDQQHAEAIGLMLMMAEDLGRLQERMWWRAGVDPDLRKASPKSDSRRETLALERKKSRLALSSITEGRDAANAERGAAARKRAEIAQHIASEYWGRNPDASASEVAVHVWRRWPDNCDIARPAKNTIRQRIKKLTGHDQA